MGNNLRVYELLAVTSIALALILVAAYMIHLGRNGDAFGVLIGAVTLCIGRVGNIGQSQAMQTMADHLGRSTPTQPPAAAASEPPQGA